MPSKPKEQLSYGISHEEMDKFSEAERPVLDLMWGIECKRRAILKLFTHAIRNQVDTPAVHKANEFGIATTAAEKIAIEKFAETQGVSLERMQAIKVWIDKRREKLLS